MYFVQFYDNRPNEGHRTSKNGRKNVANQPHKYAKYFYIYALGPSSKRDDRRRERREKRATETEIIN